MFEQVNGGEGGEGAAESNAEQKVRPPEISMTELRVSCRNVWARRSPGCSVSSQAPERKASDDVQCEDRSGANVVLLGDFRHAEAEDGAWHCTGANESGLRRESHGSEGRACTRGLWAVSGR